MNTTLTQYFISTELTSDAHQEVRDIAEVELCLIGGGEVIFVGD